MTPLESTEQQALVKHLDEKGIAFFAVPNGGKRDPITMRLMKLEGLRKGAPDMVVFGGRHGVVFLEMKRRSKTNSRVSPEQQAWRDRIKSYGFCHIVAYGAKDAANQLKREGIL